jgi:ribosome biogenesis GTPase
MSARRRRKERGEAGTTRSEGGGGEPGQVVAHHGVAVLVRFDSGDERQIWLATEQRAVVGDRVRVVADRLEVLPAHGVLKRRDPKGRDRTIAVNLDVLAIVIAPEPREPPGYIDRGFVIARAAGIEPRLVLNKIDLETGPALADRLEEIYGASALVHRVSAVTGEGLDSIREALAGGRLGALVGPSGVGKSSLLNALVPDLELRVAELDRKTGRGRHTTTTATLHPLEGGGQLVDTAGFKDFLAVDVTPLEASLHFPGFEEASERGCRFRDCLHRSEPGCSVLAGLESGEIDERRHRAYCELLDELAASDSPSGARPRAGSSSRSRGPRGASGP